jgi:hypothetical protein
MSGSVTYDDLWHAFHWVSGGSPHINRAYISRATGETYLDSDTYDVEEELPEDIDDVAIYVSVPHKHNLDLGQALVFRYIDERLPESYEVDRAYFRKRGAYARFKDLLERKGRLDEWHEYEAAATKQALQEWCEENDLQILP